MFRNEIKVMDCTIRDGGLMNKWKFSDEFVRSVYVACVNSGIDYMEIGYKSSEFAYSRDEYGPAKFCDENYLRSIVGDNNTSTKISVMVDIGRINMEDIKDKNESVIDMIRVACYVHQIDKAIAMAHSIMEKGYEASINLMAISKVSELDLNTAIADIAKSKVRNFYLVDSFGSMQNKQIAYLAQKYLKAMPDKTIGIHTHNNMQLAFSNSITAIEQGCNLVDCSILGLGRGAGNCPTEIVLGFLRNPKYKLKPIFQHIQDYMFDLQKEISWGYQIPYLISGIMNDHPKRSLEWMDSDKKDEIVAFYLSTTEEA